MYMLQILADDMGQWAAYKDQNPEIIHPTLDKLIAEGTSFENSACNTPVCSASRATWFTGRLPSQHNVHDWISRGNGCPGDAPGLNYSQGEVFTTDILTSLGYTAGISGKVHLGNQPVPQHGFSRDHYFVHQSGGGDYNDAPLIVDLECTNVPGYVTYVLANRTIDELRSYKAAGKPFIHHLHFTAPHAPYTGPGGKANTMHPADIVALYDDCPFASLPHENEDPYAFDTSGLSASCLEDKECWKGYYAAVTAMDKAIGTVLDELDTLGLTNDTLVVFSSDHGFSLTHHGIVGKGNSRWPLNLWDTNLKVPLVFRQPGRIAAGVVRREVVTAIDFAPTLLELAAGAAFSEKTNVAGASYASMLLSENEVRSLEKRTHHEEGFTVARGSEAGSVSPPMSLKVDPGARIIGSATDIASFSEYGSSRGAKFNGYKYIERLEGYDELYDLTLDPNETANLIPSLWGTGMPPYPGTNGGKNQLSLKTRRGRLVAPSAGERAVADAATTALMRQSMRQWFAFFVDPSVSGWTKPVTGRGQRHLVSYATMANLTAPSSASPEEQAASAQWALRMLQPAWEKQNLEESQEVDPDLLSQRLLEAMDAVSSAAEKFGEGSRQHDLAVAHERIARDAWGRLFDF